MYTQQYSRILIVDDNPIMMAILEELLGDAYLLKTAGSGEEALAIAPHFQPALVLLDILLPGIDGYETCRRMRDLPGLHGTKILMLSAGTLVDERLQGYQAGADDYITKPFDPGELLAKVRVYLRLQSVETINQTKTELLLLLSHKTRTPLNGIRAPLQMLVEEPDLEATTRTTLCDLVQQSANQLYKLFEKAEMLCALQCGTWDFQPMPVDLCDMIHMAIRTVTAQALERHVQIAQALPATAPMMLDTQLMQRVMLTMLENAIRFSPPHAQVVVRVQLDHAGASITVTDQGGGIAPALIPYIFEMCHHEALMSHNAAEGFSLAIARQIVLVHNDTISVEST